MDSQENTNFYNPEDGGQASATPVKRAQNSPITWTASEYIEHQRGTSWYLALAGATVIVAGLTYLISRDYFATGTIAVLGVIVGFFVGHKPQQITYEVNATGIKIGDKPYRYTAFKSFSIIHEGDLASVNLYPLKRFMPPISAYFDPKDESRITNTIGDHLALEQRQADTFDRLSRRLKL